jgi:hypothetical protein
MSRFSCATLWGKSPKSAAKRTKADKDMCLSRKRLAFAWSMECQWSQFEMVKKCQKQRLQLEAAAVLEIIHSTA